MWKRSGSGCARKPRVSAIFSHSSAVLPSVAAILSPFSLVTQPANPNACAPGASFTAKSPFDQDDRTTFHP